LFTRIGTTYGVGDNSTTFNLPNLKGRVPVGLDSTQTEFDALGETGGAKTHTLTSAEIPSHNHNVRTADNLYTVSADGSTAAGGAGGDYRRNAGSTDILTTAVTGGGGAHNNLQPYIALNYLIRIA
jgi:microcystin-dependent protein